MAARISIVTPSYNQAPFIERTLRSVLEQSRPPDEYLLFDGGSTDGTLEILRRYPQVRWISERDAGQAAAVNRGIRAASGEIIGWVNSDDIYYPGALASVEAAFRSHPDADVIYGAANHIDAQDRVIERYPTEPWDLARLRERCYLCQPAVFFRRSAVERWGELDSHLLFCMDYEYWLRLGSLGARFLYIPTVLAGSRLHPQAKTLARRIEAHAEINEMLKKRLGRVPARWILGYGSVLASERVANSFARAAATVAFAIRAAIRWNGYPGIDLLSQACRELGRASLPVGALRQYPPRALRIPPSYSTRSQPPGALPSICIVTPSLNQGRFIERTIRSVIDQGYPKLEYVVQDGGSTDATLEILARHQPGSFRWRSQPDSGQSNALNLGFRDTRGEIMAWLNSDDILLPGALNYVGAFFARNPKVDVVYSHRIVIDEHEQEIGRWILPAHDCEVMKWADFVPQETMFWRRGIWERAGGRLDESLQFAMDWDLILRFQRSGARFKRVPRFLAAFRAHPAQKTGARMSDLGLAETTRLRDKPGRRAVTLESLPRVGPYLLKHIVLQKLHFAGLVYRR